jgi:hypothetical protein
VPNRDRDKVEEAIERFAHTGFGDVKMLAGEGAPTEVARGRLAGSLHL